MSIRTTIDKAGRFPVVQTPCPFFHNQMADLDAPRAGVLHTTEGNWNPSMGVFRVHYAPHFLLGLNPEGQPEIAQLVPVGTIGAACRAHNNKAIVEIEMVAFCKEELWLPDDLTLEALAALMLVCRDEWGIPLSHPWPVGDYGRAGHNPHRSSGRYGSIAGWFGHADMPDPDQHWDPGNLRWDVVFARAHELGGGSGSGPAPVTPPAPSPSTNHDGFWWQRSLNVLAIRPPLTVDGDIGPKTQANIARFQSASSIHVSGRPDARTETALQAALARLPQH